MTRQEKTIDLKKYFDSVDLPKEPLKIDNETTILDCKKFVDSHLNYLFHNSGNTTFYPYYERLYLLKTKLEKK